MLPKYDHTQKGSRLLWGLGLALLLDMMGVAVLIYVLADRQPDVASQRQFLWILSWASLISVPLLGWVFLMLSALTVTLDETAVHLRFGGRLWRKTFPLAEITACRPVRTSWLRGWGIRFYKSGWLYNIAGLEAVELNLVSGRTYAIGTDQPEQLAAAISNAIQESL